MGSHYCFFIIWWQRWEERSAVGRILLLRISLSNLLRGSSIMSPPAPSHHCAPNHLSEDQLIMSGNHLWCGWKAFCWAVSGVDVDRSHFIKFYWVFSWWWSRDTFFFFCLFLFCRVCRINVSSCCLRAQYIELFFYCSKWDALSLWKAQLSPPFVSLFRSSGSESAQNNKIKY